MVCSNYYLVNSCFNFYLIMQIDAQETDKENQLVYDTVRTPNNLTMKKEQKYIKFQFTTSFHHTLLECKDHPEKKLKIEILIPEEISDDNYEITKYIETNTEYFVFDLKKLENSEETTESVNKKVYFYEVTIFKNVYSGIYRYEGNQKVEEQFDTLRNEFSKQYNVNIKDVLVTNLSCLQ